MESKYIGIPGFSHYRINSETKEIQSEHKKWRPIKLHRNGLYRLLSDKGNEYSGTPNRILYAAQRGINPESIRSDLKVVEYAGELRLLDPKAFSLVIARNKPERNEKTLRKEYEESLKFIQIVLMAYDTENYSQVVTEIWKYEQRMRAYMVKKNIALSKEKQDELWMQVFDTIVDAIRNRRAYIVNIWGYLTRILRTIHANIIKTNKLFTSYDTGGGIGEKDILNNGRAYSRKQRKMIKVK